MSGTGSPRLRAAWGPSIVRLGALFVLELVLIAGFALALFAAGTSIARYGRNGPSYVFGAVSAAAALLLRWMLLRLRRHRTDGGLLYTRPPVSRSPVDFF